VVWWGAAVVLGLTLLAAAPLAVDASAAALTLQRGVARLERAAASLGDPLDASGPDRLTAAAAMQREAASDIASSTRRLRANVALRASALVPGAAAQHAAALDLAESAGDAAAALGDLIEIGREARDLRGAPGPRVVELMTAAGPGLGDARSHLDAALVRLHRDGGAVLLPPLGSRLAAATGRLERARSEVAAVAAAAESLPGLLGASGARTYLLLFPNPYELRPAGGLYGSLGTLTVDRGSPTDVAVFGYDAIDAGQRVRFPVPAPLARRMSFAGDSLDIGDAGWDPDFPTTAALGERMFLTATGRHVDGTIAIDPYAIAALLEVTGPIDVTPYGPFTAEDFFGRLNTIVNVDRGAGSGKQALVPIARALMDRLVASPASLWLRILAVLAPAARGGHVMLSLHDARAAAAAREARIDGALVQAPQGEDYEMVVDANVGGTKGDSIVRKSARERVEMGADGLARHELTLRYEFPPGLVDPTVPAGADPAYRDYVRFYLPEASTVTAFSRTTGDVVGGAVEDMTIEHGKRVVGTFFRLAPGQTTELRLWYEAPLTPGRPYRLYVQKQAGILDRPLDLLVSVPGGVRSRRLTGSRDEELTVAW
jgi:hypothetical protein